LVFVTKSGGACYESPVVGIFALLAEVAKRGKFSLALNKQKWYKSFNLSVNICQI